MKRDDVELAREALVKLAPWRAEDRDPWIQVGMALQAVSPTLLPDWIAWSRQSDKFRDGECEKKWRSFKPDKARSLGVGSLIYWAREDSGPQRSATERPSPAPPQSFATLEAAISAAEQHSGGTLTHTWQYDYCDGDPRFWTVRLDLPGVDENGKPNKTFRPIRRDGECFQIADPPGALPLYRLRSLSCDGLIVIGEGEKVADAAIDLGYVATTSAHGAGSAGRSDWGPLSGRSVAVFPDEGSSGDRYAKAVRDQSLALTPPAVVRIVRLPNLAPGEDLVDFIRKLRDSGKSASEIRATIQALIDSTAPESNHASGSVPPQAATRRRIPRFVPFPVELLPEPLRSVVMTVSDSIGCDPAFVATVAMAALASAIGNTRRIRLKQGWSEPAILWMLIVATSGSQKTPALDVVQRILDELQEESLRVYETKYARYELDCEVYSVRKREWSDGGCAGEPPAKPIEPVADRVYSSEPTMEAMIGLLRERWRGHLLMRDEFSGWLASFNQYRKGQGGDVAHWLEMHSGRPIIVDRKSGKPRTIHIPRAAVSITGCIQPQVLGRLLGSEHFQNGLAARFLLAYPPKRVRRWSDADIPPECSASLKKIFDGLYALEPEETVKGKPAPIDLDLTPAAKLVWIDFFNEHGEQQAAQTGNLAAAWSKLEGYAARLALVHHCIRIAAGDRTIGSQVDETSMRAGIALSRWFGNETKRLYAVLEESDDERELRELADVIRAKGGRISVRIWQRMRAHESSLAAENELQRLVDAGLGEWLHSPSSPQGGRPSKAFALFSDDPLAQTPGEDEPEGVSSVSDDVREGGANARTAGVDADVDVDPSQEDGRGPDPVAPTPSGRRPDVVESSHGATEPPSPCSDTDKTSARSAVRGVRDSSAPVDAESAPASGELDGALFPDAEVVHLA